MPSSPDPSLGSSPDASSPRAAKPLLHRVAAGVAGAADECLDRYGPLILSIARRMFADGPSAEDAVQEAFLKLWQNAGRYDPARGSEQTFVGTLARRRMLDLVRTRRRRRETTGGVTERPSPPAADPLERADERSLLKQCWDKLTREQRAVLTLTLFDGFTYEQAAESLGQPVGTAKSRARTGLRTLRDAYRRTAGERATCEGPVRPSAVDRPNQLAEQPQPSTTGGAT